MGDELWDKFNVEDLFEKESGCSGEWNYIINTLLWIKKKRCFGRLALMWGIENII